MDTSKLSAMCRGRKSGITAVIAGSGNVTEVSSLPLNGCCLIRAGAVSKFMLSRAPVRTSLSCVSRGAGIMFTKVSIAGRHRGIRVAIAGASSRAGRTLRKTMFNLFTGRSVIGGSNGMVMGTSVRVREAMANGSKGTTFASSVPLKRCCIGRVRTPGNCIGSSGVFSISTSCRKSGMGIVRFRTTFRGTPVGMRVSGASVANRGSLPKTRLSIVSTSKGLIRD